MGRTNTLRYPDPMSVLDVSVVLPEQFESATEAAEKSGEHRLILSILSEAITVALRSRRLSYDTDKAGRRARDWIDSDARGGSDHHFTFREICDYLGVDPSWLRSVIQRAQNQGIGVKVCRSSPRHRTFLRRELV